MTDTCPLATRYAMFGPDTMRAERARGNHHGEIIGRGWDAFAAVDLAWMLGFDGYRLGHDGFVAEIEEIYGAALEPGSVDTALAGALVRPGGIVGLWIANARSDEDRALYRAHLAWLTRRAATFFA